MKKLYKIKKSKIDNRGLYAATNIKKNTKIIEYKGKIITVKETETNPKFDNNKAIYLFNLNKKYDLEIICPSTNRFALSNPQFWRNHQRCMFNLNAWN